MKGGTNMNYCRLRKRKFLYRGINWGFILVFVLSCLCIGMIVSQEVEAATVVKRLNNGPYIIELYSDHTVKAWNYNSAYPYISFSTPNYFGECSINGAKNVLDICGANLNTMVLYADGTVGGGGHFTTYYGCYYRLNSPLSPSYCYGQHGVDSYNRCDSNRVADNSMNFEPLLPNENIVAITTSNVGYGVMYADGTIKGRHLQYKKSIPYSWFYEYQPPVEFTGYCPNGQAIRSGCNGAAYVI
jgi:hypothetical protein